jgi:C1A family cysteine protease
MSAAAVSYRLCCKPDESDERDYKFAALKPALPVSLSNDEHTIAERTPLSDQQDTGTCVANASMDAFEIVYGLEFSDVDPPQLSRLFAYWIARLFTNDTDKDEGTTIRQLLAQLASIGVCLEKTWPFSPHDVLDVRGAKTQRIFAPPSTTAYMEADSNKITGYYRIDSFDNQRLDDIETAVRADHPVVFGTALNTQFMKYDGSFDGFMPPSSGDTITGRHAMIVVGVRTINGRRQFLWRNSWPGWGKNQHVWVDENYMTYSETRDLWVLTRIDPVKIAAT